MSASFCDCVNQLEPAVGLQVLTDTKYLSLRTRGEIEFTKKNFSLPVSPPLPDHEEDGGVDLVQAGPPVHQPGLQGQGRLGHGGQHHPQVPLVTGKLQPPLQVPALQSRLVLEKVPSEGS